MARPVFSVAPLGKVPSLIETAKANGREPYWYLRELFEQLPHARTRADYFLAPADCPSITASVIETGFTGRLHCSSGQMLFIGSALSELDQHQ